MRRIENLFKPLREQRLLLFLVFAIALVLFLIWRLTEGDLRDFGLNAFTETLGIGMTIFVVERLLKAQDDRKTLPLQATAYEDVRLLQARLISLWARMYVAAVDSPSPKNVETLLAEDTYEAITSRLDVSAEAPVLPSRSWSDYLSSESAELAELADKVLERYSATLDANIYALIHQLTRDHLRVLKFPKQTLAVDQGHGWPRPKVLMGYLTNYDHINLQAVVKLHRWCKDRETELRNQGLTELHPCSYHPESSGAPRQARMSDTELTEQLQIWQRWQSDNTAS